MDRGTGDDQIWGDGSEAIGGRLDGELNLAGNDVIAGDALNNGFGDGGEGGDYGDFAGSGVVLGGNDTIVAGNGDDIVSGDALAEGAEGAYAFAYSDDSIARPEDGFGDADQGFRSDTIRGDAGNDTIGGDATAIAHGDYGSFGFARAEGANLAIFGESEAPVGSDTIDGGEGNDVISGDVLAVADGGEGSFAQAYSLNDADGGEGHGGASAGDDVIYGHGNATLDGGGGGNSAFIACASAAIDRKSTRLNSRHHWASRLPATACKKQTTHH